MSDNFHFDITGAPLDLCLMVAFQETRHAVGWADIPRNPENQSHEAIWGASQGERRLVLFRASCEEMTALPAPMDTAGVEPFIRAWLATAAYGREPDHDGSNGKGWRVYNEDWGHVAGRWEAFVAIEPVWLLYGK